MQNAESVSEFVRSMPASYPVVFSPADIDEHAQIVAERSPRVAHTVLWRRLPQGLCILCVVAEDIPGLISLVSAAFVVHGLDVRSAQIHSRQRADGGAEAVDFFWVRSAAASPGLDAERFASCARTIESFVAGYALSTLPAVPRLALPAIATQVTLAPRAGKSGQWLLSIDTQDAPGLLYAIARVLHRHGLDILESQVRTQEGLAWDRFVVTSSEFGFDASRAEEVKQALQAALTLLQIPGRHFEQRPDS